MATMRVKDGVVASVVDPETGIHITLSPGAAFDAKSEVVKAHGWAFESDKDRDARTSGVEQATANPGERRDTRR